MYEFEQEFASGNIRNDMRIEHFDGRHVYNLWRRTFDRCIKRIFISSGVHHGITITPESVYVVFLKLLHRNHLKKRNRRKNDYPSSLFYLWKSYW